MKILLDGTNPFSLDLTLCCGQVFRWEKLGDWWYGVVAGKVFKIRQDRETLEFNHADENYMRRYLGMEDYLPAILTEISRDKCIEAAINNCRGLRIIRQEPWECLVSYICATYKNIASIKTMLKTLATKFGQEISFEGRKHHVFPTAYRLSKASMNELIACELGYRARYVSETAKKIAKGDFDFDYLRKTSHDEAREILLELPGVGQKVADCTLLFGLGKLEAFPVDVWVKRAMSKCYGPHFPKDVANRVKGETSLSYTDYRRLNMFGREYFGRFAGYAQEYLYYYQRNYHSLPQATPT